MADPDFEFADGFDQYGPVTTLGVQAFIDDYWTAITAVAGITPAAALAGDGLSLLIDSSSGARGIYKTLSTNYARNIGCGYFMSSDRDATGALIHLTESSTDQCCITLDSGGSISLRRGGVTGTALATYSTRLIGVSEVFALAWDLTAHNSTGIAKVWLNGDLIINLSGQDLCSTANNYYNRVGIFCAANLSLYIDNWWTGHYLASGGSETPPLDGPVIDTDWPTSDDTIDFAVGGAILGVGAAETSISTNSGDVNLRKVTADVSGSVSEIRIRASTTSGAAKFKGVIYADNGSNAPTGAPLATSDETIGSTSGSDIVCTFGTPYAIVAGTSYWIGIQGDTNSIVLRVMQDSSTVGWRNGSATYAGGLPNPVGGSSNVIEIAFVAVLTGVTDEFGVINETYPDYSQLHYLFSSAAGDEDLFGFPDLPITPANVYSVHLLAYCDKSDGGARTIDLRTKSGSTTGSGSAAGQTPPLTSAFLASVFRNNPDTGLPWSGNLAGVKHGYRIAT